MSEWKLHFVFSLDEMGHVRGQLMKRESDFAGFINYEGHYNFYFADKNIFKSENVDEGKVVHFDDYTVREFDLKKVVQELRLLQGS